MCFLSALSTIQAGNIDLAQYKQRILTFHYIKREYSLHTIFVYFEQYKGRILSLYITNRKQLPNYFPSYKCTYHLIREMENWAWGEGKVRGQNVPLCLWFKLKKIPTAKSLIWNASFKLKSYLWCIKSSNLLMLILWRYLWLLYFVFQVHVNF